MKIDLKEITVKELTDGFEDNAEQGVIAYGGKLDIRPPYQREFIYKDKQRDAVIDSVRKDFPLNVMYWAVREDGALRSDRRATANAFHLPVRQRRLLHQRAGVPQPQGRSAATDSGLQVDGLFLLRD